jgi:hypothetical protein
LYSIGAKFLPAWVEHALESLGIVMIT